MVFKLKSVKVSGTKVFVRRLEGKTPFTEKFDFDSRDKAKSFAQLIKSEG